MNNSVENHEIPPDKPWLPTGDIKLSIIALPMVIHNRNLHNSIRGLALHLMQCEYCNIGFFFRSLTDSDVAYLLHRFKTAEYEQMNADQEDNFPAIQEMTLLTFILGRAEGQTEMTPDYLVTALPSLGTLIRVEDMVRKGNIKVEYKNYSLTNINKPIVLNKTIVELLQMFREQE